MLYYKPVPPSLGYSRQPINVGSMRNAGVEIQLSAGLLRYKNWDLDLNMTHYKNKILSLDGDVPETGLVYFDGDPRGGRLDVRLLPERPMRVSIPTPVSRSGT